MPNVTVGDKFPWSWTLNDSRPDELGLIVTMFLVLFGLFKYLFYFSFAGLSQRQCLWEVSSRYYTCLQVYTKWKCYSLIHLLIHLLFCFVVKRTARHDLFTPSVIVANPAEKSNKFQVVLLFMILVTNR